MVKKNITIFNCNINFNNRPPSHQLKDLKKLTIKHARNFLILFFKDHFSPMSGTVFIQTTKNEKFSLYPFLTFFSTRLLETIQILFKCLVAACRKETEARTTENLQELRDKILESESEWMAAEILLKTKALVPTGASYSQSHQMSEKEISKMAAILQQAKDILALEIIALASLKQEPSRASSAVGEEESNTGNLEDQAGGKGCI